MERRKITSNQNLDGLQDYLSFCKIIKENVHDKIKSIANSTLRSLSNRKCNQEINWCDVTWHIKDIFSVFERIVTRPMYLPSDGRGHGLKKKLEMACGYWTGYKIFFWKDVRSREVNNVPLLKIIDWSLIKLGKG